MSFRGISGPVFAAYSPRRQGEAALVREAVAEMRAAGGRLSARRAAAILAHRVAQRLVASFDDEGELADIRLAIALRVPIDCLAFDQRIDAGEIVRDARARWMEARGWRWPSAAEQLEADRDVVVEVARRLERRYREMLSAHVFGRDPVEAAR